MKKFKILLVDDEQEFVETLSERLKMRDLKSEMALDGEEALQVVQDQEPDVMVLDLKMPGIDGMEVLRRVRKSFPKVRVVILTGHGTQKDEEQARRLGAFEYLQKPVDIEHLVKVLRKAFQSKMESTMAAIAFAEAGEMDTARQILDEDEDETKDKEKKKKK